MEIVESCKQHFRSSVSNRLEALGWCPEGDCGCPQKLDDCDWLTTIIEDRLMPTYSCNK